MRVNKSQLLAAAGAPLGNTGSEFTYDRLVKVLDYLVYNAMLLGEIISIGAIVFYGMKMALARSQPAKFTEAKSALIKAVIGAILIFGVYTVINTVEGAVGGLKSGGGI